MRLAIDLPLPRNKWRPVVGFEGLYEVASSGHVRRVGRSKGATVGALMGQHAARHGYITMRLRRGDGPHTVYVHSIVAEAFIGARPQGAEVDHLDGNRANNDLKNLEYTTKTINIRRAFKRRRESREAA